ncbi:MAG: hypothetical protein ABJB12_13795 [Pseudomonadota bacterium]
MRDHLALFTLCCAVLPALTACHSQPVEPAPAPASYEVASAAPGARGARAAGTDAAPPIPNNDRELAEPDNDEGDSEDADGGALIDGGTTAEAGPGVAL